jgi:hypothetical protein
MVCNRSFRSGFFLPTTGVLPACFPGAIRLLSVGDFSGIFDSVAELIFTTYGLVFGMPCAFRVIPQKANFSSSH